MYCVDCEVEYEEYPCPFCNGRKSQTGVRIDFDNLNKSLNIKELTSEQINTYIPKKNKNV